MQKWEYKEAFQARETEDPDVGPMDLLEEMGQQGWELVVMWEDEIGRTMYFKRPIEE